MRWDNLPNRWTRPTSDPSDHQLTLFAVPCDELLADLRVTPGDVRRWHQRGWVSFDLQFTPQLNKQKLREIRFVRNLAVAGLSDSQVDRLLETAPKPYSFDPERVAYHFEFGWVEPVFADSDGIIGDYLDDWLVEQRDAGDLDTLHRLANLIHHQIEAIEAECAEVMDDE